MRKVLGTISIILALSFTTYALNAEEVIVKENYYFRSEAHFKFSFPDFNGEESFSQVYSDRITAFATGWRRWQGYPKLRDYDVLCYLPTLLDNPFKYVFFDVGKGDSEFLIKGNRVFRDGELYGASVRNEEEMKEVLADATKLKYLYFSFNVADRQIGRELAKEHAEKFKALKYLCLTNSMEIAYHFLLSCPLEYYHTTCIGDGNGDGITPFLSKRNVPFGVSPSNNLIDVEDLYIPDEIKTLRFITITDELMRSKYLLDSFVTVEGIHVAPILSPSSYYLAWLSSLKNIRIYEDAWDYSLPFKVSIPSSLLFSEELEFLSLCSMEFPTKARFQSEKLKWLVTNLSVSSLPDHFNTESVESLLVHELTDFLDLHSFKNLKILFVSELKMNKKAFLKSTQLRELFIGSAELSGSAFTELLWATSGGMLKIGCLRLSSEPEFLKEEPIAPPDKFHVYYLDFDYECEYFPVERVLSLLEGSSQITILTLERISKEQWAMVQQAPGISVFTSSSHLFIKENHRAKGSLAIECTLSSAIVETTRKRGGASANTWYADFFFTYFVEEVKK